jgi:hypothetical protein
MPAKLSGLGKRKRADGPSEADLLALVPAGLATAFVNARMHDRALSLAGLGEPNDWDDDMPELPEDIASEDHDSLSNLLGQFASCLSTATWHGTKARIDKIFFDQVVEYVESIAILESGESSEAKRKADAATSETVVLAKALSASAQADMYRFQTMASNLKLKHATVSRVGGFVGDEVESEDQDDAPKRSTRGAGAGSSRGSARGGGRHRSRR